VPDEVSNKLIIQSHDLTRLLTKLENPGDLNPGTNDNDESVMHDNRVDTSAAYTCMN